MKGFGTFYFTLLDKIRPVMTKSAPITLGVMSISAILTLLLSSLTSVAFDLNKIYSLDFWVWRVWASQIVFSNIVQAFIGGLLLYSCRHYERYVGTRKFGAFIYLVFVFSGLALLAVVVVCAQLDITFIPSTGAYSVIFSLLPSYHLCIPKLHTTQYSLMGRINFSEKSWVYLLALQLGFSEGLNSLVPAVIGLLIGKAYLSDLLYMQNFRVYKQVEVRFVLLMTTASSLYTALLGDVSPSAVGRGGDAASVAARAAAGGRAETGRAMDARAAVAWVGERGRGTNGDITRRFVSRSPSEDAISTLMGLGFDRAAVVHALEQTENNVEAAADLLLR